MTDLYCDKDCSMEEVQAKFSNWAGDGCGFVCLCERCVGLRRAPSVLAADEEVDAGEVAAARKIPVQRKLLDLGSCEATAFQVCGIRTAGLSMALGNYHNCGPDDRIEPEYVSMADVQGMVKLIVGATLEAGTSGGPKRRGGRALRRLLGERAGKYSTHIAATHGMFCGGGGV